jgi:uncharacterized protein YndB with AHSA1/START domain
MPRASASRELLAPRADIWAFIAEPHHFADWWPGIAGVQPDRRGMAEGARWDVYGADRPTLLRRATSSGKLLVTAVWPLERFAWQLTGDHVDGDLRLEELDEERTLATLEVEAPWLMGFSRSLPRKALTRLYALCQTSAKL